MSDEAIDSASQEAVAPDANELAESSTAPVDAETSTEGSEGEVEAEPKRKPWFQSRIDELTAARREAERQNERLQAQMLALLEKGNPAAEQAQPEPVTQGRPQFEDFDSYDAYTEAVAEWKFQQLMDSREQQRVQQQQAEAAAKAHDEWTGRLNAAVEKNPDLLRAVDELGPLVSPAMAEVIRTVPNGPELLAHLDKDRAEFNRIVSLPQSVQAFQLGLMAAALPAAQPKQQTPSKPQPPAPLQTLRGGGAPDIDPSQMTDAQFAAWRREQIKARNGR